MRPTVSIIVPARNAGPELGQLLERVSAQKGSHRPEIVVVDSGSSDGTPDVARRFGADVIEIPAASFNHGLTRNLGIQHSHGEICVLLVQDALPIADHWLEALIQHFDGDPLICGVTTRQIPRPGTDIVAEWEMAGHNKYLGTEVQIRSIPDWGEFERLPMLDRLFVCNFDNVCSAIRRSAWQEHPFRSLPFAEDLDWAVRALRAGKKIVYEPAAVVLHSHTRPAIYHMRRYYISAKVVPLILGCPIPSKFASNDEQFFAEVNYLIQEAFLFSLLLDQLDGSITYTDWQQWLKCAERVGLADGTGARTIRDLAHAYTGKLWSWLPLPDKVKSSLRFRVRSRLTGTRENPMRAHFFFLLSEVTRDVSELNAAALHHVIVHCLARTLGGFMGTYYLSLDGRERVSPQLQVLDDSLCVGV